MFKPLRISAFLLIAPLFSSGVLALENEKHHHNFAKDVQAFHDLMAPLWHAESSLERQKSTCQTLPQMKALADAIHRADILIVSLEELEKTCEAKLGVFDKSFKRVHQAFHKISDPLKE